MPSLLTHLARHTDSKHTSKPAPTDIAAAPARAPGAEVCDACLTELDRDLPSRTAPLSPSTTGADAKAQRAYEVERQRVKRPADRARARQAKAARPCGCCSAPWGTQRDAKASVRDAWEDVKRAGWEAGYEEAPAVLGVTREGGVAPARLTREVLLADLVQQGKFRKAKAGDFELVPHVRSVIVLEDQEYGVPAEDEAWEHVSDSDESGVKTPSYAEIVSTAK